jgi:hypothetical protein
MAFKLGDISNRQDLRREDCKPSAKLPQRAYFGVSHALSMHCDYAA